MRKQALILFFFALVLGFTVPALAQTGTVKGYVKDDAGKPVVGAQVEMDNIDNGRKVTLKTDKNGNFFSIGVPIGAYKITITADGKPIWGTAKYPVNGGDGNPELNIDLAKERAAQANNPQNAEAAKKAEEIKKENEKIGNINGMLKEASADLQAKNYDAAIQVMEQAAQQDQTHDIVFAVLGDAYLGAKKYPEAAKAYEKAISLNANNAAVHNQYGQALAKTNQVDKAVAEYDTAAKLDPTKAGMYYFNEGAVLTNLGKTDAANEAFDKAIAADPNKSEAYYQKGVNLMGKATQKDGKYVPVPGTIEAFNKYLEVAPDGPNAQNAKDMIAALGGTVQTSYSSGKKSTGKPVKK